MRTPREYSPALHSERRNCADPRIIFALIAAMGVTEGARQLFSTNQTPQNKSHVTVPAEDSFVSLERTNGTSSLSGHSGKENIIGMPFIINYTDENKNPQTAEVTVMDDGFTLRIDRKTYRMNSLDMNGTVRSREFIGKMINENELRVTAGEGLTFHQKTGTLKVNEREIVDLIRALIENKLKVSDVDYVLKISEPMRSILVMMGLCEEGKATLHFSEIPDEAQVARGIDLTS
jgi:hypothetical protein